jgi:hypothetical protein
VDYKLKMRKPLPFLIIILVLVTGLVVGISQSVATKAQALTLNSTFLTSPFLYQNSTPNLQIYLGNRWTKEKPKIKLTHKKASLEFLLNQEESSKVRVRKETDNSLVYENVLPKTDLKYSLIKNGLKEEIILKEKPAPGENIFSFNLQLKDLNVQKKANDLWYFYQKTDQELKDPLFFIPQPFMTDSQGIRSEKIEIEIKDGVLTIISDEEWLLAPERVYPVVIDPTVELVIINPYSHPKQGGYWEVSFTTVGQADLTISPNDQNTIADLEFTSLTCDGQERTPQILEGDVIFYPNWECQKEGKVSHLVRKENQHELKFQFGDQIAYAHNWSDLGGGDHGGEDWTISTNTNIAGTHTNIGTFTINEGITATVQAYSGGSYGSVSIAATTANINGTLTGNSSGYTAGTGSGAGSGATGGSTYGSLTAPTDLGSGGGSGQSASGGAGGGAIKLQISGTLTVSGSITANGATGGRGTYGGCGGGGSAGSIYLSAGTLAGSGSITANGGDGGTKTSGSCSYLTSGGGGGYGGNGGNGYYDCGSYGGGGGGGRVATYYYAKTYTGSTTASVGWGSGSPQPGTLYESQLEPSLKFEGVKMEGIKVE